MDLLCIAHEGHPPGHLVINGVAISMKRIATIAEVPEKAAVKLISELREAGVFSETNDGVMYSRRMVRDAAASERGRLHGKTGGNPVLQKKASGVKPEAYPEGLTPGVKLEEEEEEKEKEEDSFAQKPKARGASGGRGLNDDEFDSFWKSYPRKTGKGAARKAFISAQRRASTDIIIAGLARATWPGDAQFIPHPSTWLNRDGWLDEADTPPPSKPHERGTFF